MKRFTVLVMVISLFLVEVVKEAYAEWTFYNSNVVHKSQMETWSCGPTTIAMWAGSIRRQDLAPVPIADRCCGRDGTIIPEFLQGMYNETPYGYVFSEWEYKDQEAAVKGIMWSIARFGEPVAVAGGNGTHYIVVRGGRADSNPYSNYGESNHIRGVYVNDATEGSPHYGPPVSGMYRHLEYAPSALMNYWTRIGGIFDKKYRSIERGCYACWGQQGQTYENNDQFTNY